MLRVAIVEDDPKDAKLLQEYLNRYGREREPAMQVTVFPDGLELAEDYSPVWDLIFLDIQMRHLNGLETARRIRAQDRYVSLVFITSLAQYAIQGYAVNALDYVLKPVHYAKVAFLLDKVRSLLRRNQTHFLVLPREGQKVKVSADDILYLEVMDHNLEVVTEQERFSLRASLQEMEKSLADAHFARCSNSHLVNLRAVLAVGKDTVRLPRAELPISRPRRKQFIRQFSEYLGVEL